MASTITAGTTSGTALNFAGDTSGILTVQGVPIGSTTGIGQGNASIMKNRIINGAMLINQRGFNGTAVDGSYTLDRWSTNSSAASKFTVSQSSTAPAGFVNSLLVTSSSAYSLGSTDYFLVTQAIEGLNITDLAWGTANAKTVTLSFWVQSSLTGTFGGSLQNASRGRSYPFTYTISSANTWQQISVTVAGDTTGTWNTSNAVGIYVEFGLGVGSTYSGTAGSWAGSNYLGATGATSVVGTNGATFYITGVQLEVGSSATGYEYRQYGQELALCQRYYQKMDTSSTLNDNYIVNGYGGKQVNYYFPCTMRAAPTVTAINPSATISGTYAAVGECRFESASAFYTQGYTATAEL